MIIYLATREVFLQHVREQRIEEEVRERYIAITGHKVAANEFRAWQNSLQCVGNVLQFEAIPRELGVAIEYRIHNTAKRIDLLLSGHNATGAPAAVIVELKQWETVEPTELDGVVRTFLGKGPRETTHPSYQAMSYGALLRGFNTAVVEHGIALQPCAYLHNCTDGSGLTDARYRPYLEQAPLFLRHDNAAMAAFLRRCLEVGDRGRTIERIRDGKAKPSQQLADAVERMLKGNTEFVLIDEQKVVFEKALALARQLREGRHCVLLVQGGPGTGKSVVAVNLLARLLGMGLNARYVSKNAAPRAVYRAKLTGSLQKGEYDNLFCGSACFVGCPEGFYDALIVDESHRLMTKTIYDKEGENQVKEIIHASKLAVFFLDEDQRVTFDDIGSTAPPRSRSGASSTRPSCTATCCRRSSAAAARMATWPGWIPPWESGPPPTSGWIPAATTSGCSTIRWRCTRRSARPTTPTRRGWWRATAGTGRRSTTPTPGTSRSSPGATGPAGT